MCILIDCIYSDGRIITATQDDAVIADTSIKNRTVTAGGARTVDGGTLYLFGVEHRLRRSCRRCHFYAPGSKVPTVIEECSSCMDGGWSTIPSGFIW